MAGGISVHAVDVASGRTGEGMRVDIHRIGRDGERELVADGVIGSDGALDHPITTGAGVEEGTYEVMFHIGDFFAASDRPPPPFLELVPFRFRVFDAALHYHLPIKFTPWGFSLYRGA
ncbi:MULTISPECIES: hydroxyisourate hydrolase [Roseomonadaceae]|uniref:Hydroxyisourate hydrolase n=1 Tax=Falsiroseomonas oleicola TaxID=2801474 RepID=A0ABS6H9H1_9PROT|nr:hydroxyisourate hydrolase [Roseomonas oleicola]MBU8545356.1 hydroxyisourate hydrolase [Roseomonas oleicola]